MWIIYDLSQNLENMKIFNQINGLNVRHVAQIVRRNMTTKIKPSGKVYSRKNFKLNLD
jgi:hypothetical protein